MRWFLRIPSCRGENYIKYFKFRSVTKPDASFRLEAYSPNTQCIFLGKQKLKAECKNVLLHIFFISAYSANTQTVFNRSRRIRLFTHTWSIYQNFKP